MSDAIAVRIRHDVHYFGICKEQFLRFKELDRELRNLHAELDEIERQGEGFGRVDDLVERAAKARNGRDGAGHIVIVFAAMCLEALIYDYGASNTSDNYFNKYLDRLKSVAKWVIVPKLVTGKSIDTDSQAFELVRALFKYRNDLVHFKSSRIATVQEGFIAQLEEIKNGADDLPEKVQDALRAVLDMTAELSRVDPDWEEYTWYDLEGDHNAPIRKYL